MTKAERKPEGTQRKGRSAPALPAWRLQDRTQRRLLLLFLALVSDHYHHPQGGIHPRLLRAG